MAVIVTRRWWREVISTTRVFGRYLITVASLLKYCPGKTIRTRVPGTKRSSSCQVPKSGGIINDLEGFGVAEQINKAKAGYPQTHSARVVSRYHAFPAVVMKPIDHPHSGSGLEALFCVPSTEIRYQNFTSLRSASVSSAPVLNGTEM